MNIYLVRHGQTEGNVARILEGPEGKLSEKGQAQVKELGKRFSKVKLDYIITSPYVRAKQTTEAIAKHHDVEIIEEPLLQEANLGSLHNVHYDDADWDNRPDDVESDGELYDRGSKLYSLLQQKYMGKTILLVSHKAMSKGLLRVLLDMPRTDETKFKLENTGVSYFELKEDGVLRVYYINCVKHLDNI